MSETLHRNKVDIQRIARDKGLVCVFPEANELILDLDKGMEINLAVIAAMATNGILVTSDLTTVSKNKNSHVYFRINKPLDAIQRVTLQACLGSDPVNEFLSLMRITIDANYPTALFETNEEHDNVMKWRVTCNTPKTNWDDDDIPF